jgi:hypothetical protein
MKTFKEFLVEAKIKKATGADKAKGESYSVYNTKTNKIVVTDDNKRYSGLKRNSAKELAKENPDYKVASDSWLADKNIT